MAVEREGISVRVYQSVAEHDADDPNWWLQMTPAERVMMVWRLSEEQYRMKGEFPDEPRLCRTITSVRRA
jgi:hypothetical protein